MGEGYSDRIISVDNGETPDDYIKQDLHKYKEELVDETGRTIHKLQDLRGDHLFSQLYQLESEYGKGWDISALEHPGPVKVTFLIQRAFKGSNYDCGLIDGLWTRGGATYKALKKFQKDYGIKSDGVPGYNTVKKLLLFLSGEKEKDRLEIYDSDISYMGTIKRSIGVAIVWGLDDTEVGILRSGENFQVIGKRGDGFYAILPDGSKGLVYEGHVKRLPNLIKYGASAKYSGRIKGVDVLKLWGLDGNLIGEVNKGEDFEVIGRRGDGILVRTTGGEEGLLQERYVETESEARRRAEEEARRRAEEEARRRAEEEERRVIVYDEHDRYQARIKGVDVLKLWGLDDSLIGEVNKGEDFEVIGKRGDGMLVRTTGGEEGLLQERYVETESEARRRAEEEARRGAEEEARRRAEEEERRVIVYDEHDRYQARIKGVDVLKLWGLDGNLIGEVNKGEDFEVIGREGDGILIRTGDGREGLLQERYVESKLESERRREAEAERIRREAEAERIRREAEAERIRREAEAERIRIYRFSGSDIYKARLSPGVVSSIIWGLDDRQIRLIGSREDFEVIGKRGDGVLIRTGDGTEGLIKSSDVENKIQAGARIRQEAERIRRMEEQARLRAERGEIEHPLDCPDQLGWNKDIVFTFDDSLKGSLSVIRYLEQNGVTNYRFYGEAGTAFRDNVLLNMGVASRRGKPDLGRTKLGTVPGMWLRDYVDVNRGTLSRTEYIRTRMLKSSYIREGDAIREYYQEKYPHDWLRKIQETFAYHAGVLHPPANDRRNHIQYWSQEQIIGDIQFYEEFIKAWLGIDEYYVSRLRTPMGGGFGFDKEFGMDTGTGNADKLIRAAQAHNPHAQWDFWTTDSGDARTRGMWNKRGLRIEDAVGDIVAHRTSPNKGRTYEPGEATLLFHTSYFSNDQSGLRRFIDGISRRTGTVEGLEEIGNKGTIIVSTATCRDVPGGSTKHRLHSGDSVYVVGISGEWSKVRINIPGRTPRPGGGYFNFREVEYWVRTKQIRLDRERTTGIIPSYEHIRNELNTIPRNMRVDISGKKDYILSSLETRRHMMDLTKSQYMVFVDRSSNQYACIVYYDKGKDQFVVVGDYGSKTSTGKQPSGIIRRGNHTWGTPLGLYDRLPLEQSREAKGKPKWRTPGTGGAGYGPAGSRVYALGEVDVRSPNFERGKRAKLPVALHKTSRRAQRTLGSQDPESHGCIRTSDQFIDLLDRNQLLDGDFGRYVLVTDSSGTVYSSNTDYEYYNGLR